MTYEENRDDNIGHPFEALGPIVCMILLLLYVGIKAAFVEPMTDVNELYCTIEE
jgi:hypothetical protein